ncbi:hypothetical protein RJT34_06891 [Clitoria ternatea]|uniref:Uncharacterized protein n=1 Tax=Clitoria ternatea TaxID=43366 RepID=A0AAN9K615_CLITE
MPWSHVQIHADPYASLNSTRDLEPTRTTDHTPKPVCHAQAVNPTCPARAVRSRPPCRPRRPDLKHSTPPSPTGPRALPPPPLCWSNSLSFLSLFLLLSFI